MQSYPLYSKREIKATPAMKKVVLDAYLVGENAPSVLILPGGAYQMVSDSNEGKPFAEALNQRGYNAFVLWYRVRTAARFPAPMQDVARALQFIKSHTGEWNIHPTQIAFMGSSAGGHLAAYFAAEHRRFESETEDAAETMHPAAVVLCYPVITMGPLTHRVSRQKLLGLFSGKPEQEASSVELLVTETYPPTFLWHNKDDLSVDYHNSVLLADALQAKQVRHVLHLYETGGHGIGLAQGKEAEGWFDLAFDFLKSVMEG